MDESYSKEKWLLYHENAVYKAVTTAIEQSNNFVIKSKIVTNLPRQSGLQDKDLAQAKDSAKRVLKLVQEQYEARDNMTSQERQNMVCQIVLEDAFNILAARLMANIAFPIENHERLLKITKSIIAQTRELGFEKSANLMEKRANRISF